jgi:membrane protein implicated in regulation of membrane protease activity
MQIWMWLAAAGVLLVVEMLTVDLLFASLAFSAVMAAAANAFGLDMATQGIVFGVAAAISLLVLRPIALKHLRKRPADFATNVEALVGAPAVALSQITDISGQVKLSGEVWSARSETGLIAADSRVEVVAIEGATAVVKQKGI